MRLFRSVLVSVAAIIGFAACSDTRPAPVSPDDAALSASPAASRSYVLIAPGPTLPRDLAQHVGRSGGTLSGTIPQIGIATAISSDPRFATKAGRISGIQSVVPDARVQWITPPRAEEILVVADVGNPPFSGATDFFFDLQWGHAAIEAPAAWAAGHRGAGVRVAVLDTGFDLTHPDLAPNINLAVSANFVPGESLQYGLPDPFSHGSHTAGTIAAAQNDFGTIGVAPDAELMLVKVLTDAGPGLFSWVINGIVHAADNGADVINMSFGATLPRRGFIDLDGNRVGANDIAALLNAVNRATTYAHQSGATVIASAGNSALDSNRTADLVHTPSNGPHVLAISATAPIGWATDPLNTFLDNLASYSNFGLSTIDFAAPGGDFIYPGDESCVVAGLLRPCWVFDLVFSTGNQAWFWSAGTSMAAPHTSGVAALIIGMNGGSLHPAAVVAALRRGADDLGKPGKDAAYGHGRVNAENSTR